MVDLIYILSAGHSGSTLLDMLMGSLPGVFSLGECTYLPWQLYRDGKVCELGQDICSCGKKFSECNVWKMIISSLSRQYKYDIFSNPFRFKIAILRNAAYGHPPTGLHRLLRAYYTRALYSNWRVFPDLTWLISSIVRKEVSNNWALFDTIGECLSVTHVVDSSKDPVRLHLLRHCRPSNTHVLLLVRHPLGIAASALKRNQDPIEAVKLWCAYYRQICHAAGKAFDRAVLVTYEAVADRPQAVRLKLAKFLGVPCPSDNLTKINTSEYHLVAGNPIRYRGNMEIRRDESWRTVLPANLVPRIEEMTKGVIDRLRSTEGVVDLQL